MKTKVNAWMFFEMLQKREIRIGVRFFENMFEIAAGLVSVNEKSKMEGLRHGDSFFFLGLSSYHDSKRRDFMNSIR